jgi:hypothetical protein
MDTGGLVPSGGSGVRPMTGRAHRESAGTVGRLRHLLRWRTTPPARGRVRTT